MVYMAYHMRIYGIQCIYGIQWYTISIRMVIIWHTMVSYELYNGIHMVYMAYYMVYMVYNGISMV